MSKRSLSSLIYSACMFTGMGIGWFTGHFLAGMFVGMGIGFASAAILHISDRESGVHKPTNDE